MPVIDVPVDVPGRQRDVTAPGHPTDRLHRIANCERVALVRLPLVLDLGRANRRPVADAVAELPVASLDELGFIRGPELVPPAVGPDREAEVAQHSLDAGRVREGWHGVCSLVLGWLKSSLLVRVDQ